MEFHEAHEIMRLMRRLSMAQRGRKTELLRPLDLQPGQDVVLMELSLAGSISQIELAHLAEVDEPSVGRSITRLERRGLIARTQDPDDSRRRLVTLTPEGEALISNIRAIYERVAAEAVGDFTDLPWLVGHLGEVASRLGLQPVKRGTRA